MSCTETTLSVPLIQRPVEKLFRPRRPIVLVRLMGGLGNQLFQYAAGRAIALRTGRRLWLDRSWYAGQNQRRYRLDAFHTQAECVLDTAPWFLRVQRKPWTGSLIWPLVRICPYVGWWPIRERQHGIHMPLDIPPKRHIVLQGYWQSERYFSDCAKTVLEELSFAKPMRADDTELARRIMKETSIAVHVRRGDYVCDPVIARQLGTQPAEYYQRAMQRLAEHVADPCFFLFSDDPEWVAANIHPPGPSVLVSSRKGRTEIDDLRLMILCQHFIISNSSFSWWAAYLSQSPNKIVIAPRRWHADERIPDTDICPPKWWRI